MLPHFNDTPDDIQLAQPFVYSNVLAANVPQFITVPADETSQLARVVKFKSTTGDFYAQTFTAAQAADREVNGTFASDTAWTKGAGWTIAGGVATATGAISTTLSQNTTPPAALIQGQAYYVTYTATHSAGSVTINVGGTAGTARSTAATFSEIIIAGSTQAITFSTSGFTGTVTGLTVVPCAAVPGATANAAGNAADLDPVGYYLNCNTTVISIVSAGTPIVCTNFYK